MSPILLHSMKGMSGILELVPIALSTHVENKFNYLCDVND